MLKWTLWVGGIIFFITSCKKDPAIEPLNSFFRTYTGNGDLIGRDVLVNEQGQIVACGYGTGNNGDDDLVLLFLDSSGIELSRSYVGTAGNDQCWSFAHSPDGGFVIAGWTDVNNPGVSNDILIVKTDAAGNQQWTKIYGDSYNDLSTHIAATPHGYIVTGILGGTADENSWILKLDENGDTTWTFTYGSNNNDGAMSVCVNADQSYAVTGYTNSSATGSTDGYVMLLTNTGTLRAFYDFGGSGYEEPHDIVQVPGGWMICGHAGTTDFHTHSLFEQFVGDQGQIGTYHAFGGPDHDGGESMAIHGTRIHIVGRSASVDPDQDVFYVQTDFSGNQKEMKWLGTENEDPGYGIFVDSKQVLITGYAVNPITGNKDLLVLRK